MCLRVNLLQFHLCSLAFNTIRTQKNILSGMLFLQQWCGSWKLLLNTKERLFCIYASNKRLCFGYHRKQKLIWTMTVCSYRPPRAYLITTEEPWRQRALRGGLRVSVQKHEFQAFQSETAPLFWCETIYLPWPFNSSDDFVLQSEVKWV